MKHNLLGEVANNFSNSFGGGVAPGSNGSLTINPPNDDHDRSIMSVQATMAVDSYAVFRELHSPEHLFADAFLIFEKIMDLGIKDMFYVGDSPPLFSELADEEEIESMSVTERLRWRKKMDIELKEVDSNRTALRKRCYKISNHMMREVDPDLHQHLQNVEFLPELSLLKWLRVLFSREFSLGATLTLWDYIFADVDYQLVQQRRYEKIILGQKSFYQQDEYMMGTKDFLVNMDYLALAMFQGKRADLLEGE